MILKQKFSISLILLALFGFLPSLVSAHVGYVVEKSELIKEAGVDWGFVLSPFSQPFYLALMIFTGVVLLLAYLFMCNRQFVKNFSQRLESKAVAYHKLVPWMMRLALGIALIGSGTGSLLISPSLSGFGSFASIQVVLGFFILLGLFLTPALLGAVVLYFIALSKSGYIFGNLDFLALALASLISGFSLPGLDDLLGVPQFRLAKLQPYITLVLRLGIGMAMLFLAVYEKFLNPHWSEAVVLSYRLTTFIPVSPAMWVLGAGLVEALVALCILFGFKIRLVSAVAFLVVSLSFFYFKEAVFSHVTLFTTLSILFVLGKEKKLQLYDRES